MRRTPPPSARPPGLQPPPRHRRAAARSGRGRGLAPVLAPVLILVTGLLAACGGPVPTASYFPLDEGHRWVYRQTISWENNTSDRETLEHLTLGEESLPEAAGGGRGWHRRSISGVSYWLRHDETGTYRVAMKTDIQADPERDQPSRYVLKAPLVVGTSWQASTTAYLLKRGAEFPPEIRHQAKPVTMTYQIAAVGEQVKVPAGEFKPCIRVQGTAAMRLFADPVVGFRDMPLTTTEWYCQGVGLVKLERAEPTHNATFLKGGTLVMELTEWR